MLKALTENDLAEVILLAEAFHVGDELYEEVPDLTAEHRAAMAKIAQLSAESRYELLALMWLGRGDKLRGGAFADFVDHARGMSAQSAAGYMTAKAPLAKYLRNGIDKLKRLAQCLR